MFDIEYPPIQYDDYHSFSDKVFKELRTTFFRDRDDTLTKELWLQAYIIHIKIGAVPYYAENYANDAIKAFKRTF